MFRRSILLISSRPTLRRNPRRFVYQQIPLHLSLQKNFSTASKPGVSSASGSPGKPPESNGTLSKFFIGSVALGAAFLAAYQTGYLDQYLKKEHYSVPQEPHVNATIEDLKSVQHSTDQLISPSEKFNHENPTVEITEQKIDAHFSQPEIVVEDQVDKPIPVQDKSDIAEEVTAAAKENQLPEHPQSSLTFDDPSKESINALCMAFYARSEEARQSHATQNFALRALALEDALSKGLPIETEIASLQSYLGGIDKDSVLDLVLASLPEETRSNGTDTQLQLKQKASCVFFDALKGSVRHFSFFPPGGGGMLAHSLAHLASWLKVREEDQSGDGIESVINKVEVYLAEGKLAEAADCLEESVRGTQAAEIVAGWVRQARNRAISEQAVLLLQSYANSLSLT
ncbi:hypothetical protein JHK85_013677 [Glycine max]|nr:hypothetical protein JHK85_013677 [Glycine max]